MSAAQRMLDEDMDHSMEDATPQHPMFMRADDSLLGHVLHEPGDSLPDASAALAALPVAADSESPEMAAKQLAQLRELNDVFSQYERVLSGSVQQMETFAQRISETDKLLDIYVHLLTQAQRRRTVLTDPAWPGATQAAAHAAAAAAAARAATLRVDEQRTARTGRAPPRTARAPASHGSSRASGASTQRAPATTAPGASATGRAPTASRRPRTCLTLTTDAASTSHGTRARVPPSSGLPTRHGAPR